MPISTVPMAAAVDQVGWTLQQAPAGPIAGAAVEISTRHLRNRPELTAVEHVDPGAWFIGGSSLTEGCRASFWLEIKVVDGTNTREEKESFVAAAFERCGALLAKFHPESCVHVHGAAADACGFGGQTQERRYIISRPPRSAGR